MKRNDRAFVLGRRNGKAMTVVLVNGPGQRSEKPAQPIRGPWTLRAVVTAAPAR